MKGIVFDIQKFCLQDGPGIRTCVFLKGCNMNCKWCHNPESIEMEPTLLFSEEKCTSCQECVSICTEGVHSFCGNSHVIDRSRCIHCGKCADVCLNEALTVTGKEQSVDQVMFEIEKDENYYLSSDGGVTFSGGEATLQYQFLIALLQKCKEKKYQTALETNGVIPAERAAELLHYVDLFLLDYKVTGTEEMLKWTGVSNTYPFRTLGLIQQYGGSVILRCPVIPGINDTKEHFEAIRRLQKEYSCIRQAEIMAYHDIGSGKWRQCGREYELSHIKTVSGQQKEQWEKNIRI